MSSSVQLQVGRTRRDQLRSRADCDFEAACRLELKSLFVALDFVCFVDRAHEGFGQAAAAAQREAADHEDRSWRAWEWRLIFFLASFEVASLVSRQHRVEIGDRVGMHGPHRSAAINCRAIQHAHCITLRVMKPKRKQKIGSRREE